MKASPKTEPIDSVPKEILGSAGYQPVPPGDSPGGTAKSVEVELMGIQPKQTTSLPLGKLPSGAGW